MKKEMRYEGFWYNKYEPHLPKLIENKLTWPGQSGFVKKLKAVQSKIGINRHYKGWSTCRICKKNNGSADYKKDNWTWPEGFLHYVTAHNVKPSEDFIKFIMGASYEKNKQIAELGPISDAIKEAGEEKRGRGRPPKIKPEPVVKPKSIGVKLMTQNMGNKKINIEELFSFFQDFQVAIIRAAQNFRKDPTGKSLKAAQDLFKQRIAVYGLDKYIDWTDKNEINNW